MEGNKRGINWLLSIRTAVSGVYYGLDLDEWEDFEEDILHFFPLWTILWSNVTKDL